MKLSIMIVSAVLLIGCSVPQSQVKNSQLVEPTKDNDPFYGAIGRALDSGEVVKMAVIPTSAEVEGRDIAWFESKFINYFGKDKNFHMVDRMTVNDVLRQVKLSTAISNNDRIKLGQMLDVNYLLILEIYNDKYTGVYSGSSLRLIKVDSGQVLASAS